MIDNRSPLDRLPHFSVMLTMVILMVIGLGLTPLLDMEQKPRARQGANLAITFSWPKSSPITIEQEVTSKIESVVSSVQGVKSVSSVSYLGSGRVNIQLKEGVNVPAVRFEISALMRQLHKKFHEDVSYPRLIGGSVGQAKGGLAASQPITLLNYRVNAQMDGEALKEYVELNVAPLFAQLSDVEEVRVTGGVAQYMDIVYDPLILSNYGISATMLEEAIESFMGRTNVVGDVLLGEGDDEHRITVELATDMSGKDIGEIPIMKAGDKIIFMNDLATFEKKEREQRYFFRINGHNTINMSITVDPEANIISLSGALQKEIEELKAHLQEGVEMELTYDASEKMRIELYKLISRISLSLIILLIFVYAVSRSAKYLSIISITLLANILISIILYYLLDIQLHVFSLAGIAVSFGLIIDSTIVMVDHYSYYRNRESFLAILAALLTTIGSLIIIFFMPEMIQRDLFDFSRIIIVNLSVALFVALVFVPSLVEVIGFNRRKQSIKRSQAVIMIRWNRIYRCFIEFTQRRKWIYYTALVLLFGLPVYAMPDKWPTQKRDENNFKKADNTPTWYAEAYNNTIGSDIYKEQIAPLVNRYLGGTMYLFSQNMGGRTFESNENSIKLVIRGQMPQGGTPAQLNEKILIIERLLSSYSEIERFESRTYPNGANIVVEFKEEYQDTNFPYTLESHVISQLINIGGTDWSTSGVSDEGFSNSINLTKRSFRIMLHGFSYNQLYRYAQDLYTRLNKNARVADLAIENNGQAKSEEELYVALDPKSIATNQ
ncbi:MAG: efflux RND transporter permease subunit, partial [Rikenellaceae bacterium]